MFDHVCIVSLSAATSTTPYAYIFVVGLGVRWFVSGVRFFRWFRCMLAYAIPPWCPYISGFAWVSGPKKSWGTSEELSWMRPGSVWPFPRSIRQNGPMCWLWCTNGFRSTPERRESFVERCTRTSVRLHLPPPGGLIASWTGSKSWSNWWRSHCLLLRPKVLWMCAFDATGLVLYTPWVSIRFCRDSIVLSRVCFIDAIANPRAILIHFFCVCPGWRETICQVFWLPLLDEFCLKQAYSLTNDRE